MRLTRPMLDAIAAALDAALAGDGFDGGDFDGMNIEHFERAREWVEEETFVRAAQRDPVDWTGIREIHNRGKRK